MAADAGTRPSSQPQLSAQLPQFELNCSAACDLAVVVNGNAPHDLYLTVTGVDGSSAGRLELEDLQSESGQSLALTTSKNPYTVIAHTERQLSVMPEFYLDFQGSKQITVAMKP